jgi:hypothetical protein
LATRQIFDTRLILYFIFKVDNTNKVTETYARDHHI